MRVRWTIPLALLALGFGVWLALPGSEPPLALRPVATQSVGISGEDGSEVWLVTVSITNLGRETLELDRRWVTLRARVSGRWVEANSVCGLGTRNFGGLASLPSASVRLADLLVPAGAEACQVRIGCQRQLFRWRLLEFLGQQRSRFLGTRFPVLFNWLWDKYYRFLWPLNVRQPPEKFPRPPRWREDTLEVAIPAPAVSHPM
jgi:hypothetical protein